VAKSKIHIGKKIKEILDKTPMSVVDFAKKINLTRNGAYKVFEKETIDTGQLQAISKVLNHNFFSYYDDIFLKSNKEIKNENEFATKSEIAELSNMILKLSKVVERIEDIQTKKK
jgi:predicted transcriptional regulator